MTCVLCVGHREVCRVSSPRCCHACTVYGVGARCSDGGWLDGSSPPLLLLLVAVPQASSSSEPMLDQRRGRRFSGRLSGRRCSGSVP